MALLGLLTETLPASALAGFAQSEAETTKRTGKEKTPDTLDARDLGVKIDGTVEVKLNEAAEAAKAARKRIVVPAGKYRYSEVPTADPVAFDVADDAEFIGMKNGTTDITVRDAGGRFIGFQYNYNEEISAARPIVTGRLKPAPLSSAAPVKSVDLLAHWYNDTGLECVRAARGAIGSVQWYTGEWNHTTNTKYGPYDPKRHPLLGWYRGDDPAVLDWQCYWLRESGIKAVILVTDPGFDTDSWSRPTDPNRGYWLYQLFNKVPNFKALGYVINGPYKDMSAAQATQRWSKIISLYLANPHFYVMNVDGARYPCIYIFDAGIMRTSVFGSDAAFEGWLKNIAQRFKERGFAGVAVMARNGAYYTDKANTDRYERAFSGTGVVIFESTYAWSASHFGNPSTYGAFVDNFDAAYRARSNRTIPNVMTSRQSKYHSTGWTTGGSTPELFGKALRKAVQAVKANPTVPPVVTIYNVAEWGEGGASLQPNMADGYGYLQQCRRSTLVEPNVSGRV
jgi:hypothetical protein